MARSATARTAPARTAGAARTTARGSSAGRPATRGSGGPSASRSSSAPSSRAAAPSRGTATARALAPARSRTASTGRTAADASHPRLTLLTRPEPRRGAASFAILCTLIIVATLAAVLYLNISMSETSYELTRLRGQSIHLTEQEQELRERNEQLGTPQELEKRAREIGMVPAGQPAYIDVATGKIIGDAQPAAGTAAPDPASLPPARIYGESEPYFGMGNEGH